MDRFRLDNEEVERGRAHVAEIRERLRRRALGTSEPDTGRRSGARRLGAGRDMHSAKADSEAPNLASRIDAVERRLGELDVRLADLEAARAELRAELDRLRREVDNDVHDPRQSGDFAREL